MSRMQMLHATLATSSHLYFYLSNGFIACSLTRLNSDVPVKVVVLVGVTGGTPVTLVQLGRALGAVRCSAHNS